MEGTRRGFLGWANSAFAAIGLAGAEAEGAHTAAPGEDYYEKLGVTKIINAAGTYTALTASTMPPSVQAAVARAAKHPVRLHDLQQAAGEYLAKQLKCEGAIVTAGAASGLTLATAAAMTLGNRASMHSIPTDVTGIKNEVIAQKGHRYEYDHAIRNCGAKFVEVTTLAEYEAAFTERTFMTNFFNAAESGQISREDWLRVAHKHGVPCLNDAAADVPPISNLWNYTQMGFDMVVFSGGKGMRGPQNAGLLLGKKDLIAAAHRNNSPNSDTVGRGMKVAKEQIVGMVAAVDWFLSQTDAGMEAEFRRRADKIAALLKGVPTMDAKVVIPNTAANAIPHLLLKYDTTRVKIKPLEVMAELRKGTPSIELNPQTGKKPGAGLPSDESTIVVGVWMLEPGEELTVAKRLKEILGKAASA